MRTESTERLRQAFVSGVWHQELDEPHCFLKALHLVGGGHTIEYRSAKEDTVKVAYHPDSGGGNDAFRLHQKLRSATMLRISVKGPRKPVDTWVGRDRGVTESREKTDEALRAPAEHRLQNRSGREFEEGPCDLSEWA
jgi:hypothetical protein